MMDFRAYLERVKPVVDARIGAVAGAKLKDDQLVRMLMGGKRLRAGLLCLVHEVTSGRRIDEVLDLACAVELAHSASLIIDDMLDEDETRRGAPTVHLTEGHKRAILDTVGILSLPYDLAVPFGQDYVQSLAETQRGMVTGVLRELFHRPELPASMIYDLIIGQKTGRAFGLASSWGYVASRGGFHDSDRNSTELWNQYGMHVGKAMQIADDISDLSSIMNSSKRSGFGSEMLLLRCVTAERLAQELFSDIRRLDLHFEKAKDLWSDEGSQRSLKRRLDWELSKAVSVLRALNPDQSALTGLLYTAPSEIARIMLRQGTGDSLLKSDIDVLAAASTPAM